MNRVHPILAILCVVVCALVARAHAQSVQDVEGITDPTKLAKIAVENQDWRVRQAAVEKLTDQAVLAKIAMEDKNALVRQAAVAKITDQALLPTSESIEGTVTIEGNTVLVVTYRPTPERVGVSAPDGSIVATKVGDFADCVGKHNLRWTISSGKTYNIKGRLYVGVRKDSPKFFDFAFIPDDIASIPLSLLDERRSLFSLHADSLFAGSSFPASANVLWLGKIRTTNFPSFDTVGLWRCKIVTSADNRTLELVGLETVRLKPSSEKTTAQPLSNAGTADKEKTLVRASHILVRLSHDDSEPKKQFARSRIERILAEAKKDGADFGALARKYSDCPSKTKGGDVGFLSRNMMVEPFATVAFALEVNEISGIVETVYGYHIIKVTDKKEVLTEEIMREFVLLYVGTANPGSDWERKGTYLGREAWERRVKVPVVVETALDTKTYLLSLAQLGKLPQPVYVGPIDANAGIERGDSIWNMPTSSGPMIMLLANPTKSALRWRVTANKRG